MIGHVRRAEAEGVRVQRHGVPRLHPDGVAAARERPVLHDATTGPRSTRRPASTGSRTNTMRDVLLRHFPELAPALEGVENPFAPWTAGRRRTVRRCWSRADKARIALAGVSIVNGTVALAAPASWQPASGSPPSRTRRRSTRFACSASGRCCIGVDLLSRNAASPVAARGAALPIHASDTAAAPLRWRARCRRGAAVMLTPSRRANTVLAVLARWTRGGCVGIGRASARLRLRRRRVRAPAAGRSPRTWPRPGSGCCCSRRARSDENRRLPGARPSTAAPPRSRRCSWDFFVRHYDRPGAAGARTRSTWTEQDGVLLPARRHPRRLHRAQRDDHDLSARRRLGAHRRRLTGDPRWARREHARASSSALEALRLRRGPDAARHRWLARLSPLPLVSEVRQPQPARLRRLAAHTAGRSRSWRWATRAWSGSCSTPPQPRCDDPRRAAHGAREASRSAVDPNDWRVDAGRPEGLWQIPLADRDGQRNGTRERVRDVAQRTRTGSTCAPTRWPRGCCSTRRRRPPSASSTVEPHAYRADPRADRRTGGRAGAGAASGAR